MEVKPGRYGAQPGWRHVVEMTLWDDADRCGLKTRRARADAWGATSAEFFLDDHHLAGTFHYSARCRLRRDPAAPSASIQASYASDVWLGITSRLTSQVETDGRLVVDDSRTGSSTTCCWPCG